MYDVYFSEPLIICDDDAEYLDQIDSDYDWSDELQNIEEAESTGN